MLRSFRLLFVAFAVALGLIGSTAVAAADGEKSTKSSSSDDSDEKSEKKSTKKESTEKKSSKKESTEKKSSEKKSSEKKSSKKKSSEKESTKKKSSKKDSSPILLADIAVAEYTEWIDDGLATKKDNDIVSIRHAISCGDRIIRDILKQATAIIEKDADDGFNYRYEEICDPEPKKKSSGTSTKKKTTKKKVSTADKLRQAEKARIQLQEWIDDGLIDEDSEEAEAVEYSLRCADAMIEHTLLHGREAIEAGEVNRHEVIHRHEELCEEAR